MLLPGLPQELCTSLRNSVGRILSLSTVSEHPRIYIVNFFDSCMRNFTNLLLSMIRVKCVLISADFLRLWNMTLLQFMSQRSHLLLGSNTDWAIFTNVTLIFSTTLMKLMLVFSIYISNIYLKPRKCSKKLNYSTAAMQYFTNITQSHFITSYWWSSNTAKIIHYSSHRFANTLVVIQSFASLIRWWRVGWRTATGRVRGTRAVRRARLLRRRRWWTARRRFSPRW